MVKGAGFLLNDEMGDFNPRPGVTTAKGQIGTEANQVAPGKRMLSSMTPVIVLRDGKPYLITGSPGGRTIINTVLCVTMNVLEFDMPLREAVDAPRLHQQWLPDNVQVEGDLLKKHADALDKLRTMGHHIDTKATRQGRRALDSRRSKDGALRGSGGQAPQRLGGRILNRQSCRFIVSRSVTSAKR